jgi:cytochrome c oxidase cbb3-type subunit 2
MQKPSILFTGVFGSFVLSAFAIILVPYRQIGALNPVFKWDEGVNYPSEQYPVEKSTSGLEVYRSEGCFYCHTQQLRDPQNGLDLDRAWGPRRTVARDYVYEKVPMLGVTRIGPDLTNFGAPSWRNELATDSYKPAKRDAAWIYRHLYSPRTINESSTCPPYRYLFERKSRTGRELSPDAVAHSGSDEIVPTAAARHLAEYLLNLNRTGAVPEVPEYNPEESAK